MQRAILVTGGAGYIGTHVLAVLAAAGRRCVCVDNYSNSSPTSIGRVRAFGGAPIDAYEADIRDLGALRRILARHDIGAVIHMAGLKAVGESVLQPERYRDNNVGGTQALAAALREAGVREVVFSSSATVYGAAAEMPIAETALTAPQSPYGENKLEIERLLCDLARSDEGWRIANLRYFNPVGAHPSGDIGEDPRGTPNNIMPYLCQVAAGLHESLQVFGDDYPTPDGTGVRDYVHVMDLAEGHVAALDALGRSPRGSVATLNLGTGRGHSVMELLHTFERVNGVRAAHRVVARRPGDIAVCYANPGLAQRMLGWRAARGLDDMCRDAWRWQSRNPTGYG